MDINDIKELIARDESRVLELKKTTGELIKGMQTLCAFLNSDGGWLFFGITPKLEILGQNVTDNTQQEIAHEMTKIEPAISLPIEIIDIPEREGFCVIGVHCDAARFGDAPYTYDGRAYYKVESTTVQMPRSMFEERLRRSNPSRFAWESQTPDNLHLDDLDESRIKGVVAYGVEKGRMPASAITENAMSLLDKFGMIEGDRIKNAAAAFYMTAFLEIWGTWVSCMVDACKAVGLPEPEYGTDGGFVWITFMRPNSVTNSDTNTKPSVNHVLAYTFIGRC